MSLASGMPVRELIELGDRGFITVMDVLIKRQEAEDGGGKGRVVASSG